MVRVCCHLMLLAAGVGLLTGCGRDPHARQGVTGTVTFQGTPLDQGRIQFVPATSAGPTEAGTTIENGKYSVPAEPGLVHGTYKVSIFSYDKTGAKVQSTDLPGESGATQFRERIPAKYNTATDLTAEIKADGKNVADFKLD